MKTPVLRSMLAVLLTLGAWGTTALGSSSPEPTTPGDGGEPVYVDSVHILYLESYPVQARLVVTGSLPTPCHEAGWEVQGAGDAIEVYLWSEADPAQFCITVLEPFEVSVPLGSFESADMPVLLNGEVVGQLVIGNEPVAEGTSLTGAGWSFGMCLGPCIADLVLDAEEVVLTMHDRSAEEPLFTNRGTLTAEARERITAALAAVVGVTLDPVYGCPDCADGGAAYLTILREGVISRHDIEFGNPPQELAELYELTMTIIGTLEACQSDELVSVSEDCQPQLG